MADLATQTLLSREHSCSNSTLLILGDVVREQDDLGCQVQLVPSEGVHGAVGQLLVDLPVLDG